MGRPRQVSDEAILNAARDCIREHGPRVSTAIIAAELGVSAQALLKRFGNKKQLLLAALKPQPPSWASEIASGPDERPLQAQLRELADPIYEYFVDVAQTMTALRWSELSPQEILGTYEVPPPIIGITAMSAWIERAKARGLAGDVDATASAMAFLGSIQARSFLAQVLQRPPTPHTPEGYLDEVCALFARSLAP